MAKLASHIEAHIDPVETLEQIKGAPEAVHKSMGDPFSYSYVAKEGVSIWWLHFHNDPEHWNIDAVNQQLAAMRVVVRVEPDGHPRSAVELGAPLKPGDRGSLRPSE